MAAETCADGNKSGMNPRTTNQNTTCKDFQKPVLDMHRLSAILRLEAVVSTCSVGDGPSIKRSQAFTKFA